MRRFLLRISLFLVAFPALYLLGVRLLGETPLHGNISYVPANYGHLRSRLAEADTVGQVDILFLGSSHCYRTFDTRVFASRGIRAFNLGSSNQSLLQTRVLLEHYLSQLNPSVVVIEVHPDIMALKGEESACDLLSNMPWNHDLAHMVSQLHTPRVINTALYALLRRDNRLEDSVITVGTPVNGEQVKCDFAYVPGGYVELPCHRYRPCLIERQFIELNPKQLQALEECLSLVRSRDIAVLLVEVPCTDALYRSYVNHKAFEQAMQAIAHSDPAVEYLNLNGRLPLEDTIHFFDQDHLNQTGATQLSQWLADSLFPQYPTVLFSISPSI